MKPNALECFRARCWARALLYTVGELDLHDAVDELQHAAVRDGLVHQYGQDAMQAIMTAAFSQARP